MCIDARLNLDERDADVWDEGASDDGGQQHVIGGDDKGGDDQTNEDQANEDQAEQYEQAEEEQDDQEE